MTRRFAKMFLERGAALDLACWGEREAAYPQTFGSVYALWCCRRAHDRAFAYRRGAQIPR